MSERFRVPLRQPASGEYVDADLCVGVDEAFAARADDSWLTYLAAWRAEKLAAGQPINPFEHEHWRWRDKLRITQSLLAYSTIGIEFQDQVQGMIMLVTDGHFGRHAAQTHLPLVYVEFVAVAPWNLRTPSRIQSFDGVGSILMRAAVEVSRDLEFKGRLGLHSLPQAAAFYTRLGLHNLGEDPKKHNLQYFELTADSAESLAR